MPDPLEGPTLDLFWDQHLWILNSELHLHIAHHFNTMIHIGFFAWSLRGSHFRSLLRSISHNILWFTCTHSSHIVTTPSTLWPKIRPNSIWMKNKNNTILIQTNSKQRKWTNKVTGVHSGEKKPLISSYYRKNSNSKIESNSKKS